MGMARIGQKDVWAEKCKLANLLALHRYPHLFAQECFCHIATVTHCS